MKLRRILLFLSLLSFLSASGAAYLYYSQVRARAIQDAEKDAALRAEATRNRLSEFLTENLKAVRTLAGLKDIRRGVSVADIESLEEVNRVLDHFNTSLKADVCYLMDRSGMVLASSNRDTPESFVGQDYAFRPYFRTAVGGKSSIYMALGITSGIRGVYSSHPVYGDQGAAPVGVTVIKSPVTQLERELDLIYRDSVLVTDPGGVVFISNRREWLLSFFLEPSAADISRLALTRQFGESPLAWSGVKQLDPTRVMDRAGREYRMRQVPIEDYPGWHIIFLQSRVDLATRLSGPLVGTVGYAVVSLCFLVGLSVLLLYLKASGEIRQRRAAERALRRSEETTRALLNAPTDSALLLDPDGTILALNEPAGAALGAAPAELLGKRAFDLFSADVAERRRRYHDRVLRTGKAVRYEDARDGTCWDTQVYPVQDSGEKVSGVAIFSSDITDRKKAEQELKQAQEQLTWYSRDLEIQVKERTREIASILENTPAVVYLKDREGRYLMVNARYEELFGVSSEAIRGKTDHDLFPRHRRGVEEKRPGSHQPGQTDSGGRADAAAGWRTHLPVGEVPALRGAGSIRAVCGISTDITEIKKAQDQLRRLSASIMDGQEKERAAIARELHDELGQMLTALRMDAVWIREYLKSGEPGVAERAWAMCQLIDRHRRSAGHGHSPASRGAG